MKDPVTAITGITYDRESIEHWLFKAKNRTCPVTKQPLPEDSDLTPNHTLRRLIQSWCTENASKGIDRIPTPKSPLNKFYVQNLLRDLWLPKLQLKTLRKLEVFAVENERNRKCMIEAGVTKTMVSFLVSCFKKGQTNGLEEALSILYFVRTPSIETKLILIENDQIIDSLTWVLGININNHVTVKCHAVSVLKTIIEKASSNVLERLKPEFFKRIVRVLSEGISQQGIKAALHVMLDACPWGRNRIMMVEAGAVFELIELELGSPEKRTTELTLGILFHLCSCADGRAQFLSHAGGIAMVTKRLLSVSPAANDRAMLILSLISKFSGTTMVLQEMLRVKTVSRLCMVLQVECPIYLKDKAKEILRTHSVVWKDSPCIEGSLLTRYSSSVMDEIEVPPYFLCPISMEIMKDPVTVSTGITYDRNSIEKWIFFSKNNTCPVTKQVLSDSDLTPNHTLRRLIQSWCTLNASHGMERFPTPKQPINKAQIVKLLNDAKSSQLQMKCLTRLRVIASESETNKRCMEAAGAVEFLASLVSSTYKASLEEVSKDGIEFNKASDEALSILYYLQLSDTGLRTLTGKNGEFIETLMHVMQRGNYESRAYAVLLLKSMFEVADDPMKMISLKPVFFIELVQLLHDQISYKASKATLNLLINLCPWGRNRVKAVDGGAVSLLIDLLLDSSEKRVCEMMLMVLDQLCHCAEGRAELMKHGAGLAIVSKKILRVSHVASERAVNILLSISKFSASPSVLQEMLQLGVVAKLCLVIQMDCGSKTKEKAKEVLKLHGRTWRNSPCMPMNLLSRYPS
ncbi:hypothetical protein F0562_015928 [Nyssa sinensis]|uniref:U-box domain-containing protein n=1 Tax=Nyssa sinensis TaxID=561372 RepID=A0A5J4ZKW1_9ASTE|nr:hypothetical protein F0562_015928 [Nyssa sinensis]